MPKGEFGKRFEKAAKAIGKVSDDISQIILDGEKAREALKEFGKALKDISEHLKGEEDKK